MKKLTYILFSIALLALASCNGYLDRTSKTQMNDENFWTSESNLRYFVNLAYPTYFVGYNSGWGTAYIPGVRGEISDDATKTGMQSNLLTAVPGDNWYRAEGTYWLQRTGAGPWNFGWIRKWNLMINRLDMMKENGVLTDEAYGHWMGVARFLRAYEYYRIVMSFGDVPYYDFVVPAEDFDNQYKSRDPRTMVMTKAMEDLDYAVANVRANDGANYINKYVVAAFASRFMLFEGTWYNYHPGSGTAELAKQFLQKAVSFAEVVMNSGNYAFDTDFRSLFGSFAQKGTETILYRAYLEGKATHCIASYSNLDENQSHGANLTTLKAWICNDGKPYTLSTVDNVESWRIQDMAVTRDPRFEATFWSEPTPGTTGIYCTKFIDREGVTYGLDYRDGEARPAKYGSSTNTNGAPIIRLAEVVLNWIEAKEELFIHHGGAEVTQDDINKSINAIRLRPLDAEAEAKGVKQTAPLVLADLVDDPARTSSIEAATFAGVTATPLLWEIRRERRMEFFLEQTRILDLRRWGKLELMDCDLNPEIMVGAWVDHNNTLNLQKKFDHLTAAQFGKLKVQKLDGTVVTFDGEADEDGNILSSNAADMVGFRIPTSVSARYSIEERHYLEPICTDVISQYTTRGYSIEQNPGWE
ncbi:MAG: RagB/SusD family nutrient uptake outer membrane protein [Bacteroidales bacterium]|nr:RagB/SusD family nutrient uptake outer membrane protein [Bacteroidales bacterium]